MAISKIKVSGNFCDYEGCKTGQKKKILWDVFPCGFPISGDKKGGKNKWFSFFYVRGEGKSKVNYKKKEKFFLSFRELF